MIKETAKIILPDRILKKYKIKIQESKNYYKKSQTLITEQLFFDIINNQLELKKGDNVLIHSSIDSLNLDIPILRILDILIDTVGKEGTILFPTYPVLSSFKFLKNDSIFNIKKTLSYTGFLTELARRTKGSIRSLHPTKSVCAIGALAKELTYEHHLSPYPYDYCSPYYKLTEVNGKSIGIGVDSNYFSSTHIVDDYLKDNFPVKVYHDYLFNAKCVDYDGFEKIVPTYAHILYKMKFNIPKYFNNYIDKSIAMDFQIGGNKFFKVNSKELFSRMIELARRGITIYPRYFYKWNKLI